VQHTEPERRARLAYFDESRQLTMLAAEPPAEAARLNSKNPEGRIRVDLNQGLPLRLRRPRFLQLLPADERRISSDCVVPRWHRGALMSTEVAKLVRTQCR